MRDASEHPDWFYAQTDAPASPSALRSAVHPDES
jgi:hypothetical protein